MGLRGLAGEGTALRMFGRPVEGDFRDALAGDGAVDQRPWGGRMIMRDDLPGDLGQRSHRLAGDEPGRPTSRDDGGDDAEAGAELHDFGAGGQVGLDLPDFLGFVGKGGQLAEDIPVGHQREGNFDAEPDTHRNRTD